MFRSAVILCSMLVVLVLSTNSQTKTLVIPTPTPKATPTPAPPPGNMSLLPQYVHIIKRGIDTAVGEISKPNGLTITYDNGFLAGNQAWQQYNVLRDNVAWFKEQKVNGLTLYLTRGKDQSIYATFPETCANFRAVKVDESELLDFLLMIMTYREQPLPNRDVKMKNGRPTC